MTDRVEVEKIGHASSEKDADSLEFANDRIAALRQ